MAGPKNMTHDESNIKNKALFKDPKAAELTKIAFQ